MNDMDPELGSNHNGTGDDPLLIYHRRVESGDVASRFTSPGTNMADALTSTILTSDNELNNIIRLSHKGMKWKVQACMTDLLLKTNGKRSQDGRSINAMLQSSAQILVPEWGMSGVSKKTKKDMETVKKHRETHSDYKDGENEPD